VSQVISILNRLSPNAGGITRVSLSRAEMLSLHGQSAVIALLEHDTRIAASVRTMRADGRLSPDVIVVNLYSYYASIAQAGNTDPGHTVGINGSMLDVPVIRTSEFIGVTGMQIVRYAIGSGYIFAEEILDGDRKVISSFIFLPGKKSVHFSSKFDSQSYWLEQISNHNLPAVLIADPWRASHIVVNVRGEQIFKILTMHSNHLNPPYSFGAAVKASSVEVLENLKRCDALVVLTRAQHRDLELEYGHNPKIHVIGNPLTNFSPVGEIRRDKNLAVVISRLDALKGISRIVRNFRKVIDRVPGAKLEIWGSGADDAPIRKAIDLLGLGESVTMMGYTANPSGPFRRARVSLAASEHEGFGLSFMESLSMGTPVVSYRTNYGPEEIISDGKDGFVVDDDESFVERVIEVLTNDEFFDGATVAGPENVKRFGHNNIAEKWAGLVCSIQDGTEKDADAVLLNADNLKSSAFGHVFVDQAVLDSVQEDRVKRVRILEVNRTRKFRDNSNAVAVGTYEVMNLRHEAEQGHYAFNIKQGSSTYTGSIPAGSMKMQFLLS